MKCRIMQLADIAKIHTGVNVKGDAFGEGGCPWVMVEDLESALVEKTSRRLTPEGMRTARVTPPQTVFFSRTGTVGKVGISAQEMAPSNNIIAVEFQTDKVLPLYGMYCLSAMRKRFEDAAETSVYRSLRLEDFRRFHIPVPSLPWQQRAAQQISRLQQSEDVQRQAIQHIRAATQAFFQQQFAQAVEEVIHQQACVYLGDLAELRLNGALKKKQDSVPVLYVATPQLQDWEVTLDTVSLAETEKAALQRCQLRRGDIVMNRINQEERVGQCGLLAEEPSEQAVFAQNTLLIRANRERVHPAFLFAWLVSPFSKHYLRSNIKRSTSFQCSLNRQALLQLPVPVVPLEQQEQFAKWFGLCLEYVRNGQQVLAVLDRQRQVWYDRILRLLQENEIVHETFSYQEKRYWAALPNEVYFYDTYLECIQVPLRAVHEISLAQLPEGVEFQFLDAPQSIGHFQYGKLAHCRLQREGQAVKQIWMEPVAYHPEKTEDPDTELVEREGLISEQQDFGYIRSTALLPDSAHRTAETFLQQTEGVLNREEYSRFDRLPEAAKCFLRQLSSFQQAVYEEFLLAIQPLTCHMVEQQLRLRMGENQFSGRGLQDVAATVHLLENAGLLEYQRGRDLAYFSESDEDRQLILDHRGHPIGIRTWLWTLPEGAEQ